MINFACKTFDLEQIIKCSFGLTKTEFTIFLLLLKQKKEFTSEDLSKKLNLDQSTIQRAIKLLHKKSLVFRGQINLSGGGYVFVYKSKDRDYLTKRLYEIIDGWSKGVKKEINSFELR